jgi:DNA transposition AAA+ family ATPase
MGIQSAIKDDLKDVKLETRNSKLETGNQEYNDGLHEGFIRWMEQNGKSQRRIATMINMSEAYVSQYINKVFIGNLKEFEHDITTLLRREEDKQLIYKPEFQFCKTSASILIWEVLEYCDHKQKMGVAIAPSGSGKSVTAIEYQRQNRATILIPANITTRSLGATLRLIADKTGGKPQGTGSTLDSLIEMLIKRFKNSDRLLIIDEAHFLPYEGLEALRKFNDCSGIGVAYLGQERLYDQMVGRTDKAKLFDQIFGRILMKRDRINISKSDAKMISDTIWPDLGKDELKFAFEIAHKGGRLHRMKNILDLGHDIRHQNPEMSNIEALIAAGKFSMQEERDTG